MKNNLFNGVFILMFAGIIGKVISAFYRIPLQNLTGDLGFYIYQQVYPFIGIAITLALYGLPSSIAQYVIETKEMERTRAVQKRLFLVVFLFSFFLFLLLFVTHTSIATLMGDMELQNHLRHVSWIFLFVPFVALLRGLAQASNHLAIIAHSQITEQLIRAGIIITTAIWIYQGKLSVYQIADGAIVATILAFIGAGIVLFISFKKESFNEQKVDRNDYSYRRIIKAVIIAGVIISINHMLLLFMQLADAFTVVPQLMKYHYTQTEAMEWKGIFDRGQPLLQLVTVMGSSVAMALVPQVTKFQYQTNRMKSRQQIRLTLKFCILLGIGATTGLLLLMPEINTLFYQSTDGTMSIRTLTIVLLFAPMVVVMASILQGFGYMQWTAAILIVSFGIKLLNNAIWIPMYGLQGIAMSTIIAIAFIAVCYYVLLRYWVIKTPIISFSFLNTIKATLAMVLPLILLKYIWIGIHSRIGLFLFVLVACVIGLSIYILCLTKLNVIKQRELECIPLYNKWKKRSVKE